MKRALKCLMIAAVCGVALLGSQGPSAKAADPYWNNHWQWHNNVYRPYYHRYYGGPYYYGGAPVYNGYYGGRTYIAPGYGYSGYYAPGYYGSGVAVGPLTFGWW
jgi:hypothetical protein